MIDETASEEVNARIARLVDADAFLAADPDLARAVATAGRLRLLGDGELAAAVDERRRTITGLVAGTVLLWVALPDGSMRPLHVLRPGAWFASFPLLSGEARRIALSASGPVCVLHLDEPAVDRLVDTQPVIWRWLTQLAAQHLDRALATCAGLLAERPLPRIAGRLLALAGEAVDPDAAIDLKQSDVALLSGLSRNTVSRTLGQLEASGLIARGYRRLRVLDRAGLARVAAGAAPA